MFSKRRAVSVREEIGPCGDRPTGDPGGVNVLFADSSARFIRETVDPAVWRALGSRNGGEIISDDAY